MTFKLLYRVLNYSKYVSKTARANVSTSPCFALAPVDWGLHPMPLEIFGTAADPQDLHKHDKCL